jgi:hypothetical protein
MYITFFKRKTSIYLIISANPLEACLENSRMIVPRRETEVVVPGQLTCDLVGPTK